MTRVLIVNRLAYGVIWEGSLAPVAGGAERQLVRIAEKLASMTGFRVLFVSGYRPTTTQARLHPKVVLRTIQLPARWWEVLWYPVEIGKVFWAIFTYAPHVLLLRSMVLENLPFVLAAKARQCRVVYMIANASEPTRRYHRGGVHTLVANIVLRLSDHVICSTNDQRKLMRENFRKECSVIRNMHRFGPKPPKCYDPRGPVIWVGRNNHQKRPDKLVELAGLLPDRQFLAVGIEAESRPNLRYTGRLPADRVEELLSRSSVLVNTSSSEGMPNTFIEAWSVGVPVVSLCADPDGLIRRRRLGFVCENDVAAMAACLDRLLSNEEELRCLSGRCYWIARSLFDIDKNITRLATVLTCEQS